MSITQKRMEEDLARLGVSQGMLLTVHSSLSSIGHVEGGAEAVIDAFLAVLGPSGTLMAPTFTYCFKNENGSPVFDPENTPSLTGRISETLRRRPGSVRSLHPTHSVAALGPLAEKLTSGHMSSTPFGLNSPFHHLAKNDGWILLLGCGHDTNSFIHVIEVIAGLKYVRVFCWTHKGMLPEAEFVQDGEVKTLAVFECPGCSNSFPRIEDALRARGMTREGTVGEAPCQLFRATDLADAVGELLSEEPTSLLCPQGECQACDVRRLALDLPTPPAIPDPSEWILT